LFYSNRYVEISRITAIEEEEIEEDESSAFYHCKKTRGAQQ
jgi:hypothetical protein